MSGKKDKHLEVLERLTDLNVWQRGGVRAPHKPLLLLLALARVQNDHSSAVHYSEIDQPLGQLLHDFGPQRKSVHPEYPFWYLRNDGIWVVRDADRMPRRRDKDIPTKTAFREADPVGTFTPEIENALRAEPSLVVEAAMRILAANFPESVHDDILDAVCLDISAGTPETVKRRKRDPAFRHRVLRAYEHRCAVCGFDVRLGSADLALEAAHIKWHQAGGPDTEQNGLALCAIHHKMLDRGAFSLSEDRRVVVSQEVFGSRGIEEHLMRFSEQKLNGPQSNDYQAAVPFIRWHTKEVFRGPPRQS